MVNSLRALVKVIQHPVVLGAILLVAIAAIIIERSLNDLLLDYMNPWSVLGLGIIVFAASFIFALKRPHVSFGMLIIIGAGLIAYGVWVA